MASLDLYWQPIADRSFDGEDFADFLRAAHNSLTPGTLGAELGRVLTAERIEKKSPLPLVMEDLAEVRSTTRIDGILPLQIPQASDLRQTSRQLLDFAMELGLDYPGEPAATIDDIGLCYLTLLHRRPIRVIAGLEIELYIDCPHSAMSGRKEELSLMATLPLGGQITAFYTAFKAEDRLGGDLTAAGVAHVRDLSADRSPDGRLLLVPVSRGSAR